MQSLSLRSPLINDSSSRFFIALPAGTFFCLTWFFTAYLPLGLFLNLFSFFLILLSLLVYFNAPIYGIIFDFGMVQKRMKPIQQKHLSYFIFMPLDFSILLGLLPSRQLLIYFVHLPTCYHFFKNSHELTYHYSQALFYVFSWVFLCAFASVAEIIVEQLLQTPQTIMRPHVK